MTLKAKLCRAVQHLECNLRDVYDNIKHTSLTQKYLTKKQCKSINLNAMHTLP